jgi:hypothetical protein
LPRLNLYPCLIADGTVIWTSPSGQTYLTRPGSRLLFPALCLPTGELPTTPTAYQPSSGRGIMMPTRRRTREQDRAYRIDAERALNRQARQAEGRQSQAVSFGPAPPDDSDDEPPPF